ncbi:DUF4817 domain-containing protein [Trichonephila clavipes]|nr:DUF4817 domain-containing protein [Trichonephila clavipes]
MSSGHSLPQINLGVQGGIQGDSHKSLAIVYSRILILRILERENEMYTKEEYCEMVLLYGQCNRSKLEAARLYAVKFSSRRYPSYCTIARAVQRLYKAGSCQRRIPLLVTHLQACGYPLRMF